MKRVEFIKNINANGNTDLMISISLKEKGNENDFLEKLSHYFSFQFSEENINLFKIEFDYDETEEDPDNWHYTIQANLNEIYDVIFNNEGEHIYIYRIETIDGEGPYNCGIAHSLFNNNKSPFEDGDIKYIFNRSSSFEYMKKWSFAFLDIEQLNRWFDINNEKNKDILTNNLFKIVKLKVGSNKIVLGTDQVIFRKDDVLEKTFLN